MERQAFEMGNTKKRNDRGTWAIGGGLFLGIGAGFFFLKESALAFIGCIFIGLGLGLMITAIIGPLRRNQQ